MDRRDILKNVYEDFFGVEKIALENEKLAADIAKLTNKNIEEEDIPEIELQEPIQEKHSEIDKNRFMEDIFNRIDSLYIEENSKNLLKKIIEYMRKYSENIEKQYISFDMCIYTDDIETEKEIISILEESGSYYKYIRQGQAAIYSMYDVEKTEDLENIYNVQNNIAILKDFEGFNSKEQDYKTKFLYKLDQYINNFSTKVLTIFIAKSEETIKQVFENNESIKEKFSDFKVVGIKPDVQDVYQDVLKKLKNSMEVTDDIQVKLLDYVSVTYPNNNLPYPKYRDGLCEKVLFNKEVPEYEKEKSMEEIFAELNELVGLEKVKQMLKDLVNLVELKKKTENDLKIKNINLHMVFLGNPGTGKTTVARIVAEILYNLKYIKQNKLIEVSSKDLVAEYVGQTAPKTMAVIEKAMGGVLFVDEAYSLASGNGQGNSYNEEAIATLIQAMENYRDKLVVIFAGYTREMQDFLDSNSGIVSRIGYTVEFEDYTVDELTQIFMGMMKKSGFIVSDDAIEKVKQVINENKNTKNFGNARFARNLYEKSIVKHATNTNGKKSKKILKTITAKDINTENL